MKTFTSACMLAAGLLSETAFARCTAEPTKMSDFNAANFAGVWNMQASTFYASDEFGCAEFSVSEPNDDDRLDASLRMVQLFSLNPFQNGNIFNTAYNLDYSTTGELKDRFALLFDRNFY